MVSSGGGDHLVSGLAVGHDAAVFAGAAFGVLEGFFDGVRGFAFAFEVFGEVFLWGRLSALTVSSFFLGL